MWLQHSMPDVVQQAAALLGTFDRPGARALMPPPKGDVSLRARLPAAWGTTAEELNEPLEAEALIRAELPAFFSTISLAWVSGAGWEHRLQRGHCRIE